MTYRTSLPLHPTEDDKPKMKAKNRMQRLTKKYVKNLEITGEGKRADNLRTKKEWKAKVKYHKAENKQQKIISKTGNRINTAEQKGKDKKVKRLNEKLKKQVSQSVRGLGIRYSPRKLG